MYSNCWKQTVSLLGRPRVLLPFALFALVEIILLMLLVWFWNPYVSWFMVPIAETIGGSQAVHYPAHYFLLPAMFMRIKFPVLITLGFLLFSWSVLLISDRLHGINRGPDYYKATILWNFPSIIFIGMVFVVLGLVIPHAAASFAPHINMPWLGTLLVVIAWLIGFLSRTMLIYSLLFVNHYHGSPIVAIRSSLALARRHFLLTASLMLTVVVIEAPLNFLAAHAKDYPASLEPEHVFPLLVIASVIGVFTSYFIFASTTYIAITRKKITL